MFYHVDRDIVDLLEMMMHTVYTHGSRKLLRYLFELHKEEFNLPPSLTAHHYMKNSLGKSQ